MGNSWALVSLTEIIAALGRPQSPLEVEDAVRVVAETLDAELGVVCAGGKVQTAIGLGAKHTWPTRQLLDLASSRAPHADLHSLGPIHLVAAAIEGSELALLFGRVSEPFALDEVAYIRSVGRVLGLSERISAASRAHTVALEAERHRARHDPLTGLPNRASIQEQLSSRADEDRTVTVLFVDLDDFKLTNDTLGHPFGDEVLITVGQRLCKVVRQNDVIGRLSGDEFIVLCQDVSLAQANELAERIQRLISQPIRRGDTEHVITASVGIAECCLADSPDQLVGNADLAMYRAKQRGKSRIEVFDSELRAELEQRVIISQRLRQAIRADEFVVHLQPIVDLPSCEVTSYEALVRWQHPERGLVSPAMFIDAAEKSGVMAQIDRLVIRRVLVMLAETPNPLPIAVNLSARTFADSTLIPWMTTALEAYGVASDLLLIEVTETSLIDRVDLAAAQLSSLRKLGLQVHIDDFGTGYSSLSHLQLFDVDGVKIDRSFVASACDDEKSAAIVAAVMHIAHTLNLRVVAEGVETEAQLAHLIELGENVGLIELHGQGYLFGKPVQQAPSRQKLDFAAS